MRPMICSLALILAMASTAAWSADLTVIPRPAQVSVGSGSVAVRRGVVVYAAPRSSARPGLGIVAGILTSAFRLPVRTSTRPRHASTQVIALLPPAKGSKLGQEAYVLEITGKGISIRASGPAGFLYGAQTLAQMAIATGGSATLPCAVIRDQPRFGWRGLMLDCSRTFQSLPYLRRTIDVLSRYKMNVLHLHLTDDQGWRLEIKGHPRFTKVAARFAPRFHELPAHEGFYTQRQVRDLVAYASARGVTLVPEIEMPGHCNATLVAYPDLSCSPRPYEVYPYFTGPGIQADVLCPSNPLAYKVMTEVLSEVIDLFPSRYIHIGGDECPKDRWHACPHCQAYMRAHGMKSEEELQSDFVKRIGRFIASKGRRMIGWDEILEGGLAPGAAVMSWRGTEGGVAAARAGSPVVMSPVSHCYFDYTYDQISTSKAYAFEPIPMGLTPKQASLVLGGQANMWTHIARTVPDVDRQVYPRLLALAEAVWSPANLRNWPDFRKRLSTHKPWLKAAGITYQTTDIGVTEWPKPKPPLPGRISSSSGAWQVYSQAYAFDGNPATYYWNDRPIVTGDTVTVTLDRATRLETVGVRTGRPGIEIARMHHGVLEVTEDGTEWRVVAEIAADGAATARLAGQRVIGVRIRATADQGPNWLMVTDFDLVRAGD